MPYTDLVPWVEAELRLSGIDRRMVALLQAIAETGSLNQAARQVGLSYKGAWQIIERANNSAPKILVTTATGGRKGGGSCLTETGQAMLELFSSLHAQHQRFLEQLNQTLTDNPDTRLLLQRLAVKTSIRNQLFGTVRSINPGAVNAEVLVSLTGGTEIKVTLSISALNELKLETDTDALLLINSADIILSTDPGPLHYSASNCLPCTIFRIQQDSVNAEISVQMANGETLTAVITRQSEQNMALKTGEHAWVMFKSNAPILGIR